MIKLRNPYAGKEDYRCFGCSPDNHDGLRMDFFEEGEEIVSVWSPRQHFEGYHDVLHGGIQATLMDEIASWLVFLKLETAGVTYRMETRYRAPVRISLGNVELRARLNEQKRMIASIDVRLFDGAGKACSESTVDYFIMDQQKAVSELGYPGKNAFYP